MNKELQEKITQENADEICKRIHADVQAQIQTLLTRAQKEAEKIIADARAEAEKNKDILSREAEKFLSKMKDRVDSSISLEKKRVVMSEKEKFVETVLQAVKNLVVEFRSEKEYIPFLERSISDGAKTIGSADIEVVYSFLDEKIFTGSFREEIRNSLRDIFGKDVSVEFSSSGFKDVGIIVQSKDGRLISDRRFLSLLKTVYDEVYMKLLKEAM